MSGHAEIDADRILQHAGFIRSLARGLIRDEALVDDVVQETMMKAIAKGPRHEGALVAWLRTVTRNVAYKTYRSTARRKAREEEAAKPEQMSATIDIVARTEALESLTASVKDLPEAHREVIFLRYYEGLSHAQIARQLDLAPGAVRMRLHRAQKLLQERLDRQSGGDRATWMSGLMGLAGLSLSDLRRGAEPAAGLGVSAATVGLAAAVLACVGLGAFMWLGPRQAAASEDSVSMAAGAGLEETHGPVTELVDASPRGARVTGEDLPLVAIEAPATTVGSADPVSDEALYPEGTLRGIVQDRLGNPVAGANVLAAWGRLAITVRTTTNEHGRFGLNVPEAELERAIDGRYGILLGATAEGSAPTSAHSWPADGYDAARGGAHAILRLRGKGGSLNGVVRGPDGRPIVGASVLLGDRNRLGAGFLGQQTALMENKLSPQMAALVELDDVPIFKGHPGMRGTLGGQSLDAAGKRARLLPATERTAKADGTFRFGGLDLGIQKIRISADGYAMWIGTVEIKANSQETVEFQLAPAGTLRGKVTRSDGLPPTKTLVHAVLTEPYVVKTVMASKDGSYEIQGLGAGDFEVIAEERRPRATTGTRIAKTQTRLSPGETQALDLEMHEPAMADVRVLERRDGELTVPENVSIEVRARDNALHSLGLYELDDEGRVQLPLESARAADWIVMRKARPLRSPEINLGRVANHEIAVSVKRIIPPSSDAEPREIVITLDEEQLRIAPVLLEPIGWTGKPLSRESGICLFQPGRQFTYVGWSTETPGVLQFNGVPSGEYWILVPHHGLGWISPHTVHVETSATETPLDLGKVNLPELGRIELQFEDGEPTDGADVRWFDVEIKCLVAGPNAKDIEIPVFHGRIEAPATIPAAPGRYTIRDISRPLSAPIFVSVESGMTSEATWR